MSAVVDFPPLVADEVVDAAPAVPTVSKEVALATIRTTAMSELSAVERGIAALREKHGATDYDITTPKGYKLATERRLAIRKVRYQVPHVVKARKQELNEIRDAVGTEGERIIAALKAIEDPHDLAIEAEDIRKANEAAERERVAAERAAGFRTKIVAITACVARSQGISAERIGNGIAAVEAIVTDAATWEEFQPEAETAKTETLAAMRALHASTLAAEQAAAALEAQRIENERLAAEQKAEADRLAAERAEFERQQAELKAQQEAFAKLVADQKAAADAEAARLQREQAEAAAKAQREAQAAEQARAAEAAAQQRADAAAELAAAKQSDEGAELSPAAQVLYEAEGAARFAASHRSVAREFAAPAVAEKPTLKLGDIQSRLGFDVSADFLASLGFIHTQEKASKLYLESKFKDICAGISAHVLAVAHEHSGKAALAA